LVGGTVETFLAFGALALCVLFLGVVAILAEIVGMAVLVTGERLNEWRKTATGKKVVAWLTTLIFLVLYFLIFYYWRVQ
jgi:sterol desaturase/sphingolipid hydroxylase (fatty acid hydroxylase superfamily)